jgi:hypothetical protein
MFPSHEQQNEERPAYRRCGDGDGPVPYARRPAADKTHDELKREQQDVRSAVHAFPTLMPSSSTTLPSNLLEVRQ